MDAERDAELGEEAQQHDDREGQRRRREPGLQPIAGKELRSHVHEQRADRHPEQGDRERDEGEVVQHRHAEDAGEKNLVHQRGERHEEQPDISLSRRGRRGGHVPLTYRGHETGWKEKLMRVMFAGGVVTICLASGVVAQVRDRSAVPATAPRSDADAMAAGWTAAARGQVDVALKEADGLLTRRPWDRGALMLKINALAAATPLGALDVYERWIVAGHGDDAGVLEPVAIGVLNEIANGRAAELKRPALRALAAARVAAAQPALDALAPSPETQAERDIELARSGDPAAAERLNREAAAPESATPASAKALSEIGLAGEPCLLLLLKSRNPPTRSPPAEALGPMESQRAREPLKPPTQDARPVVRDAVN